MVVITEAHTRYDRQGNSPFEQKQENIQYLDLHEYIDIAKHCICKYCTNKNFARLMLLDEDAISFITEELILGTAKWNPEKGASLKTYLNHRAIWAIGKWKYLNSKIFYMESLNIQYNHSRSDLFNNIIDTKAQDPSNCIDKEQEYYDNVDFILSRVTSRQRECLSLYFLEAYNKTKIAKKLGITKEAVRQHIQSGLNKINKMLNKDNKGEHT